MVWGLGVAEAVADIGVVAVAVVAAAVVDAAVLGLGHLESAGIDEKTLGSV